MRRSLASWKHKLCAGCGCVCVCENTAAVVCVRFLFNMCTKHVLLVPEMKKVLIVLGRSTVILSPLLSKGCNIFVGFFVVSKIVLSVYHSFAILFSQVCCNYFLFSVLFLFLFCF